jgi:hypothetical protein
MNKKIKVNDLTSNINGTSLIGYVKTTYANLVEQLGEPERGWDKSTAHWSVEASDGTVATIYDWKTDFTPEYEYEWHIGGHYNNKAKALLLVEICTNTIPEMA